MLVLRPQQGAVNPTLEGIDTTPYLERGLMFHKGGGTYFHKHAIRELVDHMAVHHGKHYHLHVPDGPIHRVTSLEQQQFPFATHTLSKEAAQALRTVVIDHERAHPNE